MIEPASVEDAVSAKSNDEKIRGEKIKMKIFFTSFHQNKFQPIPMFREILDLPGSLLF